MGTFRNKYESNGSVNSTFFWLIKVVFYKLAKEVFLAEEKKQRVIIFLRRK